MLLILPYPTFQQCGIFLSITESDFIKKNISFCFIPHNLYWDFRMHETYFCCWSISFKRSGVDYRLRIPTNDRLAYKNQGLFRDLVIFKKFQDLSRWYCRDLWEPCTLQLGQTKPLIFSTTPRIGIATFWQKLISLRTSCSATSCGNKHDILETMLIQ